ncbi:uncharacterized protein PAC_17195 [Phialocephala subalpina]|uniref:CBM1 domain-containing protein n=1 Tax=Phialocephala subalpina TaxID=576137 RepID=A0A1L7XQH3_9HELO|nr:uncharacterized protein PAC_17195 [Phialocephala subalpina]
MRYHSLFYASVLPVAIVAQSGAFIGSGSAHPTALPYQSNTTTKWNSTYPIPRNASTNASSKIKSHPAPSGYSTSLAPTPSANVTGVYILSFNGSKTAAVESSKPHTPYTKSSGPLFTNTTEGFSRSTGTGKPVISGSAPLPYHTAPAITTASSFESTETASASSHLPFTNGVSAFFTNSTSAPAPTGGFAHASGTAPSAGFAHPTGVSNITKPATKIPSALPSGTGRLPFSVGSSAHFANGTASASGEAGPTGTGGFPHTSGTGASTGFAKPTGSQGFTSAAAEISSVPSSSATSSVPPTGRLPLSSGGAHFLNSTSGGVAQPTGSGFISHASGTGASSGFAKPTEPSSFTKPAANSSAHASATSRLPFTTSAGFFFNSTSGVAQPTGTGYAHVSGTGVSSGFAKPTGEGNYTSPALNTKPVSSSSTVRLPFKSTSSIFFGNSTIGSAAPTVVASSGVLPTKPFPTGTFSSPVATSSGRLPYTKSSGLVFTNSTSIAITYPTGIASSSAVPSGPRSSGVLSSGSLSGSAPFPYTKTSGHLNSTTSIKISSTASDIFPSGALPTGIVSSGSSATATALPYSRPSGPLFTNSTAPAFSTGVLPTGIFSSGAYATGTGYPISKPVTTVNATSSVLPSSSTALPFQSANVTSSASSIAPLTSTPASPKASSKHGSHPHTKQTVTITVTASPVTITVGESTVTTTQIRTPSITSSAGSSAPGTASDEITTVTVTHSASSLPLSATSSTFTSLPTGKVQVPTSSSNATIPLSTGVSKSAPSASVTTLITKVSSSGTPISSTSASASASAAVVPEYYQCGGLNWTGSTTCAKGNVCKKWNPYYSQCIDERYA